MRYLSVCVCVPGSSSCSVQSVLCAVQNKWANACSATRIFASHLFMHLSVAKSSFYAFYAAQKECYVFARRHLRRYRTQGVWTVLQQQQLLDLCLLSLLRSSLSSQHMLHAQ